jgi:hypothetical protein
MILREIQPPPLLDCDTCNEPTTSTCDCCHAPLCCSHLDRDGLCAVCASDPKWIETKAAIEAGKDVRWTGKAYEILN